MDDFDQSADALTACVCRFREACLAWDDEQDDTSFLDLGIAHDDLTHHLWVLSSHASRMIRARLQDCYEGC